MFTPRPIEIVEMKETLEGAREEFSCFALEIHQGEAVLLYRSSRVACVGDVELPAGTMTLAYYWVERSYNVYHWLDGDGKTLGFYFNVSDRTVITRDRVSWRDLAVDLFVAPDGKARWLDEEELPERLGKELCMFIEAARRELDGAHARIVDEIAGRSAGLLPLAVRLLGSAR